MDALSSRDIRIWVAEFILGQKEVIEAAIQEVREEAKLTNVLHYFTQDALPVWDLTTIMIQQLDEISEYTQVYPSATDDTFRFNIWILAKIEDDQERDDLTSVMATIVKKILNSRHLATEIESGKWLWFDKPPIQRISYGLPSWGTVSVGAAQLLFVGKAKVGTDDMRPQGRGFMIN